VTTAIDLGSTKVGALTPLSETEFKYERFRHGLGDWVGLNPDSLETFQDTDVFERYLARLKKLLGGLDEIDQVVATAAYRYLPQGQFQKILWRECGLFPLTISIEHEGELLSRAIKSSLSKASSLIGSNFVHLHVGGLSTEVTFDLAEYASPIQRGFEHYGFSDPSLNISKQDDIDKVRSRLIEKLEEHNNEGAIAILMRNLPTHTKLVVSGRFARQLRSDSGTSGFELSLRSLRRLNEHYMEHIGDSEESRAKFFLTMFLIRLSELGGLDSVIVSDSRMAMGQVEIIRSAKTQSKVQSELLRRSLLEFQYSLPYPNLTLQDIELVASISSASTKKTVGVVTTLELLRPQNEPHFTSSIEDLFMRNHFAGLPRDTQERIVLGIKGQEGGSDTARRVSKLVRLILNEGARVSIEDSHLVIRAPRLELFKDKDLEKPFNRRPLKVKKL